MNQSNKQTGRSRKRVATSPTGESPELFADDFATTPETTPHRVPKRVTKSELVQDAPPAPGDDFSDLEETPVAPPPAPESPTDDPELSELFAPTQIVHSKKIITQVHASTKPPRDKFFRVLPFDLETKEHAFPVYLFEYRFEDDLSPKSFYVIPGTDAADLLLQRERLQTATLVLGVTKLGTPFVWELKNPDGRNENADQWAHSRIEKAELATTTWIKLEANTGAGGYDHHVPEVRYEEPDWSKFDYAKLIKAASKNKTIRDLEHDAVKEALGL